MRNDAVRLAPIHDASGDYSPSQAFIAAAPSGGVWVAGVGNLTGGPDAFGNFQHSWAPFLTRLDVDGNVLWQEMVLALPGDAHSAVSNGHLEGLVVTAQGQAVVAINSSEGSILESFDSNGVALASIQVAGELKSLAMGADGIIYAAAFEWTFPLDGSSVTSRAILVSVEADLTGIRWKQSYSEALGLVAARPCGGLILAGTIGFVSRTSSLFLELDEAGHEQRRLSLSASPSASATYEVFPLSVAAHGADGIVVLGQYTGGDLTVGNTQLSGGGRFLARLGD